MEREEFKLRVERHGEQLKKSPKLYKLRMATFALFGYAVYGTLLILAVGLLLGAIALLVFFPSFLLVKLGLKLGIPLLLLVLALFASLKVAPIVVPGHPLDRDQAPELFAILDELKAKLHVSHIDRVVLSDDYNASVLQQPRFGFFGSRNTLTLGMPLLQAISREDLRVVLAHELGHLSGNHSRFSGWVYRVVVTFGQLLENVGSSSFIETFLEWYVPRLEAMSFPLRRQNEYEADADAAALCGSERAAQALVNVATRAALLTPFWKQIERQVIASPHPPAQLFSDWGSRVPSQPPDSRETALKQALGRETGWTDTHPSLRDRVAALGATARLEDWTGPSAAQRVLGDRYDYFVQQAGYQWSSAVQLSWSQRHSQLQERKRRLGELEALRQQRLLTADEVFEYADSSEDVVDQDPLPLFRAAHEMHPAHPGIRLSLGRLLAERDDAACIPLLEAIADEVHGPQRLVAVSILADYHERQGNNAAHQATLQQVEEAADAHVRQQELRTELRVGDHFVPHGFSADRLASIIADLALLSDLKRAFLVKKDCQDGGPPIYVIGCEPKFSLLRSEEQPDDLPARIMSVLSFDEELWVISLPDNAHFRSVFRSVDGSLVLSR